MTAIGARIEREFPDSNKGWGVIVERYADTLVGTDLRTALLVLMTATGLVLLIGCANLANLALARGVSREREVAIRASIGAGRWRLIRQFLTENVLLSLCGGVLGIVARLRRDALAAAAGPAVFVRPGGPDRDGHSRAAVCPGRVRRHRPAVRHRAGAAGDLAGADRRR